jgi:hypothetical protein
MRPVAPVGSLVRLRPVAPGEALRGAIVAVDAGDRVVIHRVVRCTATEVVTRGIASRRPDPPRPRAQVLGVVAAASGVPAGEGVLRAAAAAAAFAYRVRQVLGLKRV